MTDSPTIVDIDTPYPGSMKEYIRERIVVAANFTIEPIHNSLRGLLAKIFRNSELALAPYNQVFRHLLDPGSLFHENRNGVNMLFLRLEDLIDSRDSDVGFIRKQFDKIKAIASELAKTLGVAERFSVPLFVFLCPASAGIQNDLELASGFDAIEQTIRETASNFSNIYVFGTDHITLRYRIAAIDNPTGNILGHVPYTTGFTSALAVEAVRKFDAYRREPFKVLVLDCDNTLWDGVIGEDGLDGIGISAKRLFLQNFAIAQSKVGMVICLNSKNNEADVWEVFDKRDDMVLKKEHVVSSRINWLPKSQNLRSIAEELQLGMDSFVFIDDDPVVCDEVQRNCPEVLTILLPAELDDYRGFFDHLWVFDKLKITEEDRQRTRSYQDQVLRRDIQAQAGDVTEFLASLELVCEIADLNSADIPRVSQLTMRTNQFNLSTIRLTEADMWQYISDNDRFIWTVKVRDRFGDYGLVGIVIFEELQESLLVRSFMLSCRILGRAIEHQIVKELGKKAQAGDIKRLLFNFVPTAKNAPIMNFLNEIGERSEAGDAGKTVYEVSAKGALICSPQPNPLQKRSALSVETAKPVTLPNSILDTSRFQAYVEMAHSLSNNGSLTVNGAAGKLSRENLQNEFRVARTDTERKLTQIWEQLLNANDIGTADDFFEIGGDSLVAVALFVEIEAEFGRSFPISTLVNSPTIEKLARIIEFGSDRTTWEYLVPIQPEGNKRPLFCIHAAGGNVLFYSDLAKALGSNQPLYGLQARGVADRSKTAHDRIEEMAQEYLREIRMLQPVGPYQLSGSSFGGLVAFEAALQLNAAGQSVSLLALFDTHAPGYSIQVLNRFPFESRITKIRQWASNAKYQVREIDRDLEKLSFLKKQVGKLTKRLKRKILWKGNEITVQYRKAMGRELPMDIQRNHRAIQNAEDAYKPEIYHGEVVLFRAAQQPENAIFDPFLGWGRFTTLAIKTMDVPGTHGALTVYPFATHLAEKLDPYLGGANERNNGSFVAAAANS